MEILASVELWVAILMGGVAVKILDSMLPHIFNRSDRASGERGNLRKDIEYLRGELNDLRTQVVGMEKKLKEKNIEISQWSSRYWEEKIQNDKIVTIVRHYGDDDLRERVGKVMITQAEAVASAADGVE